MSICWKGEVEGESKKLDKCSKKNALTPSRPLRAIIKPDNQECWRATGEHDIFPPATLQSNDPPKVFSLTLTTAYKRDQFLPPGQCEEMESFNGEWRWGQNAGREITGETLSSAEWTLLHYKMLNTSVELQLSRPVAGVEIRSVLYEPQSTAVSSGYRSTQIKKNDKSQSFWSSFCRYVLPIHHRSLNQSTNSQSNFWD